MRFSIGNSSKIIFHDETIESEEIIKRVGIIANYIQMSQKRRIVIFMEPCPDVIYAIMAVLNLGLTYIPISTTIPKARLNYILNDCDAELVITQNRYISAFHDVPVLCIEDLYNKQYVIDYPRIEIEETAYIIYTSGTTGCPKGVEISYGAIDSFMNGIIKRIPYTSSDRIAFFTEISFDIFFVESIMAVIKGLTIILADANERRNPRLMGNLIRKYKLTILQMTPSRLQLLAEIDTNFEYLKSVRTLLIGGEIFPASILGRLQKETTVRIFNLYGPTEATIWFTVAELTYSDSVNIGLPFNNTEVYIINNECEILENGEIGEIVLAGESLAKGYLKDEIKTKEKFLFLESLGGRRIYRTGDLGKYNEKGYLEYIGRKDNQIKHKGYRIELEEIENMLNEIPEITGSFVIYEDKTIIAVYKAQRQIDAQKICCYLTDWLPEYMIPSAFLEVKDFEYTTSGKIDKKRTYENCHDNEQNNLSLMYDENHIFKMVSRAISKNLHMHVEIELDSNFGEMGVDSITFIQLIVSLEKEYGFKFEDEKLMVSEFPNVRALINCVVDYIKMQQKDANYIGQSP